MESSVKTLTARNERLILFVLFLSGISALINQMVWIRKFGLVFGVDVYTMGTVLSAFMGGLALGSLFFGRLVDKSKNPLKLFLLLELGIAVFAFLFPLTFEGLIHLYTAVIQKLGISANKEQFVKFAFSFTYLLIPATLMGGTLPVVFKIFIRDLKNLGWKVSNLYAINNLGAVAGCFVAGFLLIRYAGLTATLYTGAVLNLINALLVLRVSQQEAANMGYTARSADPPIHQHVPDIISAPLLRIVLIVFVIEGFATLAYEILWTRIFVGFSYDKTTYFTTVIVLSFIFGLSLGSYIFSRWIDKGKDLVSALALIEILIGLCSFGLLTVFAKTSLALNLQRNMFETWINTIGKEYLLFFMILLIPTTLTGMVFPIVSRLYADNMDKIGKRMGNIGLMDTAGSVAGSFAAGFLMIPSLGVVWSFITIVMLNILLGIMLLLANNRLPVKSKVFMAGFTAVALGALLSVVPDKQYFSWWDKNKVEIWSNFVERIPFYDEGPDATVTLREYNNFYSLNINGHNTAYTTVKDQIANRMLGYIPYMVHQAPKRAMVVGFGLGFTVESLIQPEIDTVDVAEICKGVIRSGHALNSWNNNVIDNHKVRVYLEDGRGFLFKTKNNYDIITCNAIHPRLSNNIYTRDFYKICQKKLRRNGIMCQWATPNWMTETEYKAQVKAFIEVFSYCQLWYLNEYSTILIGSDAPLVIDYGLISKRFEHPKVQDDLKNVFMSDPAVFTSQYSMGKEELEKYCADTPSNTDDFPIVEFSTTVNIAPDTNALKFFRTSQVDYSPIVFNDTLLADEKSQIVSKMQFHSGTRNHIIEDLIAEVKRQSDTFRLNRNSAK